MTLRRVGLVKGNAVQCAHSLPGMPAIREARIQPRLSTLATRRETTVIDPTCQAIRDRCTHSSAPHEEI